MNINQIDQVPVAVLPSILPLITAAIKSDMFIKLSIIDNELDSFELKSKETGKCLYMDPLKFLNGETHAEALIPTPRNIPEHNPHAVYQPNINVRKWDTEGLKISDYPPGASPSVSTVATNNFPISRAY